MTEPDIDCGEVWQRTVAALILARSIRPTDRAWLRVSRLDRVADGVATIVVPSEMSHRWMLGRLNTTVREALEEQLGHDVTIEAEISSGW